MCALETNVRTAVNVALSAHVTGKRALRPGNPRQFLALDVINDLSSAGYWLAKRIYVWSDHGLMDSRSEEEEKKANKRPWLRLGLPTSYWTVDVEQIWVFGQQQQVTAVAPANSRGVSAAEKKITSSVYKGRKEHEGNSSQRRLITKARATIMFLLRRRRKGERYAGQEEEEEENGR